MRIPWAALRHVWDADPDAIEVLFVFGLIILWIYGLIRFCIQKYRQEKAKKKLEEIFWRKLSEQEMKDIITEIQRIKTMEEIYGIRR